MYMMMVNKSFAIFQKKLQNLCALVSFGLDQQTPRAGSMPQGKPATCSYADPHQRTVTVSGSSNPGKPAAASDNGR